LLQDARLILLDEPFTSLDAKTISDLLDLIHRWHGERRTILIVLHDLDLARAQFPETLLLARQAVAWGKTQDVLTAENLLKARQMCEAFDRHAEVCETDAA
jgi:zinc/manganese transport system ATP-binding protein